MRQYPGQHQVLVSAGHEIVNHTETHPNLFHADYDYANNASLSKLRFNEISLAEREQEVELCHKTVEEVLSYTPRGFRTPHFGHLHVNDVYGMLKRLGYTYSSSVVACHSSNGGFPHLTSSGVWEFPLSPCPDHPFGVLDSWHSLGKRGARVAGHICP